MDKLFPVDDPTAPLLPYLTDMEQEMADLAMAEQADNYYLSMACGRNPQVPVSRMS